MPRHARGFLFGDTDIPFKRIDDMTTDAAAAPNRETWLNLIAAKMAPRFADMGHPLPPFRVAVGFPSAGMKGRAIAECWDKRASGDNHFEIFLRPDQQDSMMCAANLAHELVHAAVGLKEGHGGAFAKVALAIGLNRPLTATTAGPDFITWCQPFIDELGPIPHAPLSWRGSATPRRGKGGIEVDGGEDGEGGEESDEPASSGPRKQRARLLKAECRECGYTVRVTSKWLDVGPPHCPNHGAMAADGGDA